MPPNNQRAGIGSRVRALQPPAGVDPEKFQSALDACRSLLGTGAGSNGAGRSPRAAAGPVVVYEITGNPGRASIVYVDSGGANDAQVSVPSRMTVSLPPGAPFSVIAQGTSETTIGCQVLVDGKVLVANAATVPAVAECDGTTP